MYVRHCLVQQRLFLLHYDVQRTVIPVHQDLPYIRCKCLIQKLIIYCLYIQSIFLYRTLLSFHGKKTWSPVQPSLNTSCRVSTSCACQSPTDTRLALNCTCHPRSTRSTTRATTPIRWSSMSTADRIQCASSTRSPSATRTI